MHQDDLEDDLLFQFVVHNLQSLRDSFSSLSLSKIHVLEAKTECIGVLLLLLVLMCWLIGSNKLGRIHKYLLVNTDGSLLMNSVVWEEQHDNVSIYAMQGHRPSMEDRFIVCSVPVVDGQTVKIASVLDGHGGEFAVDFVKKHLLTGMIQKIKLLKVLSSASITKKNKIASLAAFRKDNIVTKEMLKCLHLSEAEFKILAPNGQIAEHEHPIGQDISTRSRESQSKLKSPASSITESVIRSSRHKPLEELPAWKPASGDSEIDSVLSLNTGSKSRLKSSSSSKTQSFAKKSFNPEAKGSKLASSKDLSKFILNRNTIAYDDLLRNEIAQIDVKLVEKCQSNRIIGGTTLLFSIIDQGTLWVANVGDSRGILVNTDGEVTPLSYDHKPSLLKERKRIEDSGGYICWKGVWRVQGLLATSRALGNYKLQGKKTIITCEPDVMAFKLSTLKPSFALLATDGLWDAFTNEIVAEYVDKRLSRMESMKQIAADLARDAHKQGVLDNITIVIIDLQGAVSSD